MKKEITTLHKGNAPVRARFLRDAHYKGEDLEIVFEEQTMTIPHGKLKEAAAYKILVEDKFGKPAENLYYYKWNPDADFEAPPQVDVAIKFIEKYGQEAFDEILRLK